MFIYLLKGVIFLIFVGIDIVKLPTPSTISNCNLTRLTNFLTKYSIGDINNFDSPAKLLAFAGLKPCTYQSGKFTATHATMVKHVSKDLRWAFLNSK